MPNDKVEKLKEDWIEAQKGCLECSYLQERIYKYCGNCLEKMCKCELEIALIESGDYEQLENGNYRPIILAETIE